MAAVHLLVGEMHSGLFSHKRFLSAAFPQCTTIILLPFALFPCLHSLKTKTPISNAAIFKYDGKTLSEDAQISPLSNQGPATCMADTLNNPAHTHSGAVCVKGWGLVELNGQITAVRNRFHRTSSSGYLFKNVQRLK